MLQDELEEAGRQKQYLDQLYTLMLERAPELLEHLEQDFEGRYVSDSKEIILSLKLLKRWYIEGSTRTFARERKTRWLSVM